MLHGVGVGETLQHRSEAGEGPLLAQGVVEQALVGEERLQLGRKKKTVFMLSHTFFCNKLQNCKKWVVGEERLKAAGKK